MQRFLILICAFLLSGCLSASGPLPQETQSRFLGHSINEVEARLGPANNVSNVGTGLQYSWSRSDTRWTTISSSQKMAGTHMVNGRNVATIINGPPIRTMQTVSCSLNIMTDKQGKITSLSQNANGISCSDLVAKL